MHLQAMLVDGKVGVDVGGWCTRTPYLRVQLNWQQHPERKR
jgi:hypothetical protein